MDLSVVMAGLYNLLSDLQQSDYSPRHYFLGSAELVGLQAMGKQQSHRGLHFLLGIKYLDSFLILEMIIESLLIFTQKQLLYTTSLNMASGKCEFDSGNKPFLML